MFQLLSPPLLGQCTWHSKQCPPMTRFSTLAAGNKLVWVPQRFPFPAPLGSLLSPGPRPRAGDPRKAPHRHRERSSLLTLCSAGSHPLPCPGSPSLLLLPESSVPSCLTANQWKQLLPTYCVIFSSFLYELVFPCWLLEVLHQK